MNLSVNIAGVTLKNPVVTASGTFGSGFEYLFYLDFSGNIKDDNTMPLMRALSDELTDFSFLGNYREI